MGHFGLRHFAVMGVKAVVGSSRNLEANLLLFEKSEPTKEICFFEHRVPAGQKAYSMTKPIRVEHLDPCVKSWGGAKRKGRKETEVAWKVTAEEVKARGFNLDFKNPHAVADDHGESCKKSYSHG